MRNVNKTVLSASDNQSTNGSTIDANQLVSASFQAYFADTQAAGTFKIQASNDIYQDRYQASLFTVVNWVDVPNQSANITSGGSALLTIAQSTYRWLRAVYTTTATGVQTIVPIADTGVRQAQTVTTIADSAGSLNSTYFLLSSVNTITKAQKNFYLWLDDGAGVDPAIAGRTGIHVTYSDNDTANTIATNIRAALNGLTNDFAATGSNAAVIITDVAFGPVTAATDGAAPTGFTFGSATLGVASNLNNKYFYLNSANGGTSYFVWLNVDGIGTAPVIAGRTAVPATFVSGSSIGTVGTALAAAIDPLANFIATGTTTVTVTNSASGPFTPMTDAGSTGFTFAVTGGGNSTITVNLNALSV